jgi:hypothetical protein
MRGQSLAYENKLPRAPPNSTISYLESIGLEKDALYALRYVRMCERRDGDLFVDENSVGASRLETRGSVYRIITQDGRPTLYSMPTTRGTEVE